MKAPKTKEYPTRPKIFWRHGKKGRYPGKGGTKGGQKRRKNLFKTLNTPKELPILAQKWDFEEILRKTAQETHRGIQNWNPLTIGRKGKEGGSTFLGGM